MLKSLLNLNHSIMENQLALRGTRPDKMTSGPTPWADNDFLETEILLILLRVCVISGAGVTNLQVRWVDLQMFVFPPIRCLKAPWSLQVQTIQTDDPNKFAYTKHEPVGVCAQMQV
jgi:hypothetical protein